MRIRRTLAGVALALALTTAIPSAVGAQEISTEKPATDSEGGGVGGAAGAGRAGGGGLHSHDDENRGGIVQGPKSAMERINDAILKGLLPPGILFPTPTPNGPCGEPDCFGWNGDLTLAELEARCALISASGGPADAAEEVFQQIWCPSVNS